LSLKADLWILISKRRCSKALSSTGNEIFAKIGAIPWMKTFNKSNFMEKINAATE